MQFLNSMSSLQCVIEPEDPLRPWNNQMLAKPHQIQLSFHGATESLVAFLQRA